MGVYVTNDPVFDFRRWEREQQEWEDSLPCCELCGEKIDDYVYDIDDQILCLDCVIKKYRRDVEDYMK